MWRIYLLGLEVHNITSMMLVQSCVIYLLTQMMGVPPIFNTVQCLPA